MLEHGIEPSFARCLYVQGAYFTMSNLEHLVMMVAMIIISLACAQEWNEWSRLRWLRRRCLSHTALPARCDALAVFKWLATWIFRLIEALSMQGIVSLIPSVFLSMSFANGTDSVSILLNGLSVVFILTIDNFVPSALLNAEALQEAADVLAAVAVSSMPEDKPTRGQWQMRTTHSMDKACVLWGARATTLLYILVLNRIFYNAGHVKCELMIHTLYYRVSLTFGLWAALVVRSSINALLAAADLWTQQRPLNTRTCAMFVLSGGARALESWLCSLFAAILLNIFYWYCINILYYSDYKAFDLFSDYVWDVFGLCANGPPWNGACQPLWSYWA
jgi:hypothetical protein